MNKSFSASVSDWSDKALRNVELVMKQSTQDVFEVAQKPVAKGGNMPVDTGFLRNSFVAGLNGSTSLTGPDSYVLAVRGMRLGDVMFGGWTADYAPPVEYGARGRAGRYYMRSAAQQWQAIVAQNAAKVT